MENVLVIGAAGFIGMQIVKDCILKGYKVYAIIRSGDAIGRAKLNALNSSIVIYESLVDINKDATALEPFKIIFNLATVGITPDYNDINLLCDVNIKLACQVADFAVKNNASLLVHFGSCFEYGDHGNIVLTENDICIPESLYAITKFSATKILMNYSKMIGLNTIIVRPFGVFGEGEGRQRLAPSIIRSCMKGEKIDTTFGQQIRDFVDVKDVSKSIISLSELKYESYNIYNICSNHPISVREFIIEIINTCGFDLSLVNFGALEYRKNESMFCMGDNSKLQNVINYNFPSTHTDGILDIYKSYMNKNL